MTKRKLMGMALSAVLAVPSAEARSNWTIYPDPHKPVRDGVEVGDVEMTGPQQITNAMTQAATEDTLRILPGTYDFTGISMLTEDFTKDNVTYTVTNHIFFTHSVNIVGYGTTGHWSDEVVFRGDGTGRCLLMDQYWARDVRNITFENFNAGNYPDTLTTELRTKSNGGAVQCVRGNGAALAISNCVFRNCRAANGGAVHGGGVQDCLFTSNVAFKCGGAVTSPGKLQNCEFRDNWAYSVGACYLGVTAIKVRDCFFEGNASVTNGIFNFGVKDCSVSNCTFVGNCCTNGNGGVVAGGNSNVPFLDCVFSNNWAALAGGAFYGCSSGAFLTNCVFVGNSARRGTGGAVSFGASAPVPVFHRCVFEDNWATNNNHGGAIYSQYGAKVTFCAFTNNVSYGGVGGAIWCCNAAEKLERYGTVLDSDFYGNYGNDAGATYRCNASNCTFTANRSTHRGGAMYYGKADDCRFYDNYKQDRFGLEKGIHPEYGGGCATAATLTRCEITGGSLWSCALTDCHIYDYPSTTGLGCVFYEGNWATNCLIENCACGERGVCYNYGTRYAPGMTSGEGARALFTHCTFADNTLHNNGGFFCGHSGKRSHPVTFEGCILSGNKKKNGTEADISGYYVSTASQTHYRNCLYGADDGTFKGEDGLTWGDDGGLLPGADPHFVAGSKRYPDAPHYALRPGSCVRGKGDATIFTDADVDLAGNPRKRDGKLDLGCYQCWLDPIGLLLLFK